MHIFSHNPLNRQAVLRTDEVLVQQLFNNENTRFIIMHGARSLVREGETKEAAILGRTLLGKLPELSAEHVFLGTLGEVAYFALGFNELTSELQELLSGGYTLEDLRTIAQVVPAEHSALLAHARAMLYWHARHQHCSDCGAPTQSKEAGYVRDCTGCGKKHFPRTDTAVIVLISEGDACLLGRQAVWPKGQYATLAGFLEPGETLEQAVARETEEETGVQLQSIAYHSSQPCPFPGTLMVGFMATAVNRNLNVNYDELEDAQWFTRQEITAGLKASTFRLPSPISISYNLIRTWFDAAPGYSLDMLLK